MLKWLDDRIGRRVANLKVILNVREKQEDPNDGRDNRSSSGPTVPASQRK